jgi:hypothetical protein
MTSMIKTNVFFDVTDFQTVTTLTHRAINQTVREVFIVHVGGTRCVTSSTDNIMNIRARKTLTVEFIRTGIFVFLLYV